MTLLFRRLPGAVLFAFVFTTYAIGAVGVSHNRRTDFGAEVLWIPTSLLRATTSE